MTPFKSNSNKDSTKIEIKPAENNNYIKKCPFNIENIKEEIRDPF